MTASPSSAGPSCLHAKSTGSMPSSCGLVVHAGQLTHVGHLLQVALPWRARLREGWR